MEAFDNPAHDDNNKPSGGGLKGLLARSFIGRFSIPVENLILTDSGRPQREAGVLALMGSIKSNGWLSTAVVTVCAIGDDGVDRDGGMSAEEAAKQTYRVIDGNHRCEALKRRDRETGERTAVVAEVHNAMDLDTERLVASFMNATTELVVETTLVDRITWYKNFAVEEEAQNKSKTPLSVNVLATRMKKKYQTAGLQCPSLPTLKKYMRTVENMSDLAVQALLDVTHLPDRRQGHLDLNKTPGLEYKRISHKALLRDEFKCLSPVEQEAYIYRLGSGFALGLFTDQDFKDLDATAKVVGRVVSAVEAVAPRDEWSDKFRGAVHKARTYDACTKFITHHSQQDFEVESYTKRLPAGMPVVQAFVDSLLGQPWPPLIMEMKADKEMTPLYEAYVAKKKECRLSAEAAVGAFKQKVADRQKEAKAAAAAATAASAAKALLEAARAASAAAEKAAATATAKVTESVNVKVSAVSAAASGHPKGRTAATTTVAEKGQAAPSSGRRTPSSHKQQAGKRKRVEGSNDTEATRAQSRSIMTKMVEMDVLGSFEAETEVLHPEGRRFMVAFLNIASDPFIVKGSSRGLRNALCFLSNNLDDRGTLVMALPDWEFERDHLRGLMTSAGLMLEDSPVVSLYLGGKSGRVSDEKRLTYPSQGSVTVLAHKTRDFVCNGGGARLTKTRASRGLPAPTPPRTPELDLIGAVVSECHPPSGTFLASSVADLLIKRFSDAGDAVLATAAERDGELSRIALREGRSLIALVADPPKTSEVSDQLDTLCGEASKMGLWARMLTPPPPPSPEALTPPPPSREVPAGVGARSGNPSSPPTNSPIRAKQEFFGSDEDGTDSE